MKRIFGLLAVGCVLYACSPILKYGKYSHKCRGRRGPYECSYIIVNTDSTYHLFRKYDVGGGLHWTGKWVRIGNALYVEDTVICYYRRTVGLDSLPPQRDTFIIKKNRLIEETQKIKWKKGNEWGTGEFIFKNSKVRSKYKFVPAEN